MSWIEGIGDEVLFFVLSAILVAFLLVLAWKSTEVPDPGPVTVRFTVTSRRPVPNVHPESSDDVDSPNLNSQTENDETPTVSPSPSPLNPNDVWNSTSQSSESNPLLQPERITSEEVIQGTNLCEGGRDEISVSPELRETVSEIEKKPGTSVSAEDGDGSTSILRQRVKEKSNEARIKIRLMYMDDTQKVIEANNQQRLGDFKRQYFEAELAANKTIKLIFNAKVLDSEGSSLSQLGLDDNCVVHCLVINRQPSSSPSATNTGINNRGGRQEPSFMPPSPTLAADEDATPRGASASAPQIEAGIDVGGLLVPLFGVILGLVWYCRIAYATHFTTAATIALVGLSGLCLVSFFVVCFPIGQDASA